MSSWVRHTLTVREREILRLVVTSFIEKAGPVGSLFLAKTSGIGLSPATIRNTMSDLEGYGYLDHPHTSAGRIPTELGYRCFVDDLMGTPRLSDAEERSLGYELEQLYQNTNQFFRESSRLLGRFSNLLGVVLSPKLSGAILERMEAVQLSSSRVMFVVSLRSGLVKTVVLELESQLKRRDLDRVVGILNERLAGLRLEEIRKTCRARICDLPREDDGIVRLILQKGVFLLDESPGVRRVQYAGTQNILRQPEFQEASDLHDLIEMLEDEDFVVHLLEDPETKGDRKPGRTMVRIGRESGQEKVEQCSIVTAPYRIGQAAGTIGVIGPMRMRYDRVLALVESIASRLSRLGDGSSKVADG